MSHVPHLPDSDPAAPPAVYPPLAPDPFAGVEVVDAPAAPPRNMAASKGVYFFYYAALACLVPFMSLYYQEQGLNGTQIGILAGTIPLVTWVSAPFWGGIADARKRHRAVLLLTIAGLWAAVLALYFARSFNGMLATVILYAFFIGPIVPLVDNAVLTLLGDHKAGYGRVRLWGSLGWGLAASLLGALALLAGCERDDVPPDAGTGARARDDVRARVDAEVKDTLDDEVLGPDLRRCTCSLERFRLVQPHGAVRVREENDVGVTEAPMNCGAKVEIGVRAGSDDG